MSTKLTVCLLSPHPLVLSEFERLLSKATQFKVIPKQLESTLAPDLRSLEPPKAQVYVIDAHAARQATGALLTNNQARIRMAPDCCRGFCQRHHVFFASPSRCEGHPHLRRSA